MLDENLPAFYWKKSPDGVPHHEGLYMSYQGSDPELTYTLKHGDPKQQAARNCYAAALFDAHIADVLYGEVLVQPNWATPTLSQEEIRRNGGIPPPPQATIPGEFTIQMYEPEQQIVVKRKVGGLTSSTSYEFALPQTSFRTPSTSALDREHNPAAELTTPKLNFVWKREHRLSKDYTCFMTGKSTDTLVKKSHRDPDIAVAVFRSSREVTIYEPNLSRVEMEDLKGLELVVLLSIATIKDLYLSSNPREILNLDDTPARKISGGGTPKPAQQQYIPTVVGPYKTTSPPPLQGQAPLQSQAPPQPQPSQSGRTGSNPPANEPGLPITDARTQWEIDAETARLRAQVAAEEKEQARRDAQRRKEQQKADEAETKRLRKLVEQEQKEAKKKQQAIDEETARLRRKYGKNLPQVPARPTATGPQPTAPQQSAMASALPHRPRPVSTGGVHPGPHAQPAAPSAQSGRPFLHPNPSVYMSTGAMMSGANPAAAAAGPSVPNGYGQHGQSHGHGHGGRLGGARKSSFLGLRDMEEEFRKVSKKKSSLW